MTLRSSVDSSLPARRECLTTTHMKKTKPLILGELLLLFSSILIFRSAWLLLDQVAWASSRAGLLTLLILGCVLSIFALKGINKQ